MTRSMLALALLAATSSAVAAPTRYTFDSVSRFGVGRPEAFVIGILQGQTTPQTVVWRDGTDYSGSISNVVSSCIPMFLTMTEKPGKYLLIIDVDPVATSNATFGCSLEVKS